MLHFNQVIKRFIRGLMKGSFAALPIACFVQAASAQVCDGFDIQILSFSNPTLISGTDLQPGAIYEYTNVAPGIDGTVEILGFTNGGSIANIDNDAGLTEYFQPEFIPNPAGGSSAAFRVSFVNAATGAPAIINFAATQIDVDGDSVTLREFIEFDAVLSQFTVDASTELLNDASGPTTPNFTRFESTTSATAPGIDPTAQANAVRAVFENQSSYDFVYGTLGAGATTRLASVGFDCPPFDNPVNVIPEMEANLVTTKVLAAGSIADPEIGDVVGYVITVTNNGPDSAANVSLSDSLPTGLTATANNGAASAGSYNGTDWTLPILLTGDTETLTLEGTVDADQGGNTITNTLAAPAVSDATDPSTAGDDLTEVVVVVDPPAPSLAMEKVADSQGPHKAGDLITYTYTITNDGNQIIRDIAINDTHNGSDPAPTPINETLITDAAPAGDSVDAASNGSWDALAPGDVITFTGTYTVTQLDVDNL